MKGNIIQFFGYTPRIYSGFDNFQIRLSAKLKERDYQNILVYSGDISILKLESDIIKNHGKIEIISTHNTWTLFRDIFRLFIRYKPAIVHTHFDNRIHLVVALLSVVFRAKYYFSFWSEISSLSRKEYKQKNGLFKLLSLQIFYRSLVLISKRALMGSNVLNRQFSCYFNGSSTKINTFYLGTELYKNTKDKDLLREKYSVPIGYSVFTNISAIEYIKGIHTLVEAAKLLREKYQIDNFICFHVGTVRAKTSKLYSYYDELKLLVKQAGLEANFVWLEFIDDITDILRITDVYVHPSLEEGLGSANLEAATQSLPIIGSNVGGIPEIVFHGINGYMIEKGSAEDLAYRMNSLICSEEMRKEMGLQSLSIVNELFDYEKQTQNLVDLYFKVI